MEHHTISTYMSTTKQMRNMEDHLNTHNASLQKNTNQVKTAELEGVSFVSWIEALYRLHY